MAPIFPSQEQNNTVCNYIEWSKLPDYNSLTVLSVNARSLVSNFSSLVSYLSTVNFKFTFIIVVESWLNKNKDIGYEIDGYKSHSIYRDDNRRGGGIKIYFLENISVNVVNNFTVVNDDLECLILEASIPSLKNFFIGGIYRPPGSNINNFLDFLNTTLNEIDCKKCIISGDTNLNLDKINERPNVRSYVDLFTSYGYLNTISLPTYVSSSHDHVTSCIDHFWTNISQIKEAFVITPLFSDHHGICTYFSLNSERDLVEIKFRDYSRRNIDNFNNNLESEFSRFIPGEDVEIMSKNIILFLKKLQDKYFPIKNKKISNKRLRAPWITPDIIKCIKKRHDWYKLVRRNVITRSSYNYYCRRLNCLLTLAVNDYYRKKLLGLKSNPKSNWKTINKLMNNNKQDSFQDTFTIDGSKTSDLSKITNGFNDYFISYPASIRESISPPSSPININPIPRNENNMFMHYATNNEIIKIIKELKKEGGLDDISRRFLKLASSQIAPYLRDLFNKCIQTGLYPTEFKIAKVTPVYKKAQRDSVTNYRPISVLSNLSKIFETLIYNRIKRFFHSYDLLSNKQFGFRDGSNTELATLHVINKIMPSIQDRKFAICVFLDYRACFDTICRNILFTKLERYGVRGLPLELIKSYFHGRKQFVCIKKVHSMVREQNIGVIQGSKTGPLFFDIYANDFNSLCLNDENILYADDTSLVYLGDDVDSLCDHVNSRLSTMLNWCKVNQISLNVNKCEYMLITNRINHAEPYIYIGNESVERTNCFKYLGVFLDSSLRFHKQVDTVYSRLSKVSGISYRLRNHLDESSAKKIYYAFVQSILSYCICIWGGVIRVFGWAECLEKIQKRILKNLFYNIQNECIFKTKGILKFSDLYKVSMAVYMYDIISGRLPSLSEFIPLETRNHPQNTRNRHQLITPYPRVATVRCSFKFQIIDIWNRVPENLKSIPSRKSFKKSLTRHFLDLY